MKSLKKISLALSSILLCAALPANAEHQVSLTINTDQQGAQINKNIYGQFVEHLGRGIYEGIWVGNNSDIPNTNGFRNDVVTALKELKVPLMRWPGGCFADEYHWRDGIGDPAKRPTKVNTHWGGVEENNEFGTHEFFQLAEMVGSETYVNGNLGTGTPREMAEWLEYMTSDKNSTLANERRKNGRDKPFKVDYFAIGNEAWGCGGHMRPAYYADLYMHWATFLKAPKGHTPKFIASGGSGNVRGLEWTDVLSKNITRNMDAISYHYYTLPTNKWDVKGKAIGFPESEWNSTIVNTLKIDEFIAQNLEVLEKNDPKGKIGFYVDEWGTWYDAEPGREPGFLYQQNTIRDAVVAAANFNIFHHYAERVRMTNIAQMVNVLQAMILTDKEKMLLTPTYYAYQMYIPFQDSTHLTVDINQMDYEKVGEDKFPAVSVSAAKGQDGKTYLALVNLSATESSEVKVDLKGQTANSAQGQQLTANTLDAHNTFNKPNQVKPKAYKIKAKSGKFSFDLPARSVTVVKLD
ncbi:alpha-N-arabinofuranosidase [Catenovulum sp. 2E275]|uniref:alpha-N-arabinofuranosidase n=1 Tax=Catenovulum sp. 2E275 TaxID=2980497 RepID=UPI0021CFE33B|nr:alpha-L-arabinofuranosidase C-terminal domain-containing protein [Catenovulum sp. 2E275]MCU4674121.1 alpha-N-arabinofuranosidase [Catenovulum sp. 2E275]